MRNAPDPWKDRKWSEQDGLCHWCKKPMERYDRTSWLFATVEHLRPRAYGGGHDEENLRLAHRWCNEQRGKGNWQPWMSEAIPARIGDESAESETENRVRRFLGFPPLKGRK